MGRWPPDSHRPKTRSFEKPAGSPPAPGPPGRDSPPLKVSALNIPGFKTPIRPKSDIIPCPHGPPPFSTVNSWSTRRTCSAIIQVILSHTPDLCKLFWPKEKICQRIFPGMTTYIYGHPYFPIVRKITAVKSGKTLRIPPFPIRPMIKRSVLADAPFPSS